jgi:hypothetical protein
MVQLAQVYDANKNHIATAPLDFDCLVSMTSLQWNLHYVSDPALLVPLGYFFAVAVSSTLSLGPSSTSTRRKFPWLFTSHTAPLS